MQTYVIGDIHGSAQALTQCLERAGFDRQCDTLISLGDLCDGWPETPAVYDLLLDIPQLLFVRGNHDQMMLDWIQTGIIHPVWLENGGRSTMESYSGGVPERHRALLEHSVSFVQQPDRLFVHAGIREGIPLDSQDDSIFLWDRGLFKKAINAYFQHRTTPLTSFQEVYIGHCPIHRYGLSEPVSAGGVWMMDTGAGWEGRLSLLNLETGNCFQSEIVQNFYPPGSGRSG